VTEKINIEAIILDSRLQSRVKTDENMIDEFVESMEQGDVFPPVQIYLVDETDYYLVDGWHRVLACKKLGYEDIDCVIKEGTWREAKWASFAANKQHGLRPSRADRRKQLGECLHDPEWSAYSDNMIAKHCGCSRGLVLQMRKELKIEKSDVVKTVSGGKVSTTNIKKQKDDGAPEKKDKAVKPAPVHEEEEESFEGYDEKDDVIADQKEEIIRLQDRLAIAAFDASDEEKELAQQTIDELREQVRVLEIAMVAVKTSRDTFQKENAEMKKQILAMQKKLKSYEPK
jgi:FtsZ-binding cell division protein ZapB